MSMLEQYDIMPGKGPASLQQAERDHLPVQDFFDQAADILPAIGDTVRADIVPELERRDARWHPAAYMVYALGTHATLGSLRLHIWPRDLRVREQREEGDVKDVHDHVLHIASLVLKGTYSDNIYHVQNRGANVSDEELVEKGLLRVFTPPLGVSGSDAMITDGRVVSVRKSAERVIEEGNMHTIEAGVFHAPTIPEDRLAATLSFSSHRANLAGPHILFAARSTEPVTGIKRPVMLDEAQLVKQQILSK
jgi:hypothetical protein